MEITTTSAEEKEREQVRVELTEADYAEARRYSVEILWSEEDQQYLARVPEIPGLLIGGASQEAALDAIVDLIAFWIVSEREEGFDVPAPRQFVYSRDRGPAMSRRFSFPNPPMFTPEQIEDARLRAGLTQQALANLLNASVGSVRSWSYGNRYPEGPTLRLLEMFLADPEGVRDRFLQKGS